MQDFTDLRFYPYNCPFKSKAAVHVECRGLYPQTRIADMRRDREI